MLVLQTVDWGKFWEIHDFYLAPEDKFSRLYIDHFPVYEVYDSSDLHLVFQLIQCGAVVRCLNHLLNYQII